MTEALIIAQFALQYGIPAAQKLVSLLRVANPTEEQWNQVWSVAEKGYAGYIEEAKVRVATGT